MSKLKIVAVALGVLLLGLFALASTQPDTLRVQRSLRIDAPREEVFALINDFRAWASWSPYDKLDPALKRTYSGAERGKGAVYGWQGNSDVGSGRMEVMASSAPAKIVIDLQFIEPFQARNVAEFTLEEQGQGEDVSTNVTWAMHGPAHFVSKLMGLFVDMDHMIGKDFETGLSNLKALAEK